MIAMIAIVVLKCFSYSDYKPPSEINPFVYKPSKNVLKALTKKYKRQFKYSSV